jgi:hypothetical protein
MESDIYAFGNILMTELPVEQTNSPFQKIFIFWKGVQPINHPQLLDVQLITNPVNVQNQFLIRSSFSKFTPDQINQIFGAIVRLDRILIPNG